MQISTETTSQQSANRMSVIKYFSEIKDFQLNNNPLLLLWDSVGWVFHKSFALFTSLKKLLPIENEDKAESVVTNPPGPEGHFGIGLIPEFVQHGQMQFTEQLWKTYSQESGICQFQLGPKLFYLITNPEYIKTVALDSNIFARADMFESNRYFFGNTILSSEGSEWQKRSQELLHHLIPKEITKHHEVISNFAQQLCQQWSQQTQEGKIIEDLSVDTTFFTLSVIAKTLLNVDLRQETKLNDELQKMLTYILTITFAGAVVPPRFLEKLPIPFIRNFKQVRETLAVELTRIIKNYREKKDKTRDYYIDSLINQHQDESNEENISKGLLDDILLIFIAGFETTAKLLIWTFFELAQNPTVTQKLYQEIDTVLQGREPTVEDMEKLTYLSKVVQESLRYYSPAGISLRDVTEDTKLGPYDLRKGSYAYIGLRLLTKNQQQWDKPEEFNPDRFESELTKKNDQYFFTPFHSGKHRCPGQHLVLYETKLLLALSLQKFEFRLADTQEPVQPVEKFAMEPDKPIKLALKIRSNSVTEDKKVTARNNSGLTFLEQNLRQRKVVSTTITPDLISNKDEDLENTGSGLTL